MHYTVVIKLPALMVARSWVSYFVAETDMPSHCCRLTAMQHTGHSAYLCFTVLCWQWAISFTDSRPHLFCNVPLSCHFCTGARLYCMVTEAAGRIVSRTHKFNRGLTHLLHWNIQLDVPQRIQFKLGVTVRQCLQGNAPQYRVDCCKSTTDVASR